MAVALPRPVPHVRPLWTRGLRLYRANAPGFEPPEAPAERAHVRSTFRCLDDPDRLAMYSILDATSAMEDVGELDAPEHHTLVAVREFRRVPLDASGLRLVLFRARPGCAASVIAALAHWVERAVSIYQPTYVLLAHSLEYPGLTALLAGVRERRALEWARPTAFSMELVLPEIAPKLARAPEHYIYCRPEAVDDPQTVTTTEAVSPFAV